MVLGDVLAGRVVIVRLGRGIEDHNQPALLALALELIPVAQARPGPWNGRQRHADERTRAAITAAGGFGRRGRSTRRRLRKRYGSWNAGTGAEGEPPRQRRRSIVDARPQTRMKD
jgi:hypothetical protein